MKATMLGCGASNGVPVVGCDCDVCKSNNPKNKRLRCSMLIQSGNTALLVDSSPDLRQQALEYNITDIDGVLYTHPHADHCHGIEDLREFGKNLDAPLPVWGNSGTIEEIKQRFGYAFNFQKYTKIKCCLTANLVSYYANFNIGDFDITTFPQQHNRMTTTGYIFNNKIAYCTDINKFPDQRALDILHGIDVFILDCLRYEFSYAHFVVSECVELVREVQPKSAIFIHMSHDIEYENFKEELKYKYNLPNAEPAYDGMIIECL